MAKVTVTPPEWMNEKFLIACIEKNEGVNPLDIIIENQDVSYMVPPGVNFLSVVYNINVVYYITKGDERYYKKMSFVVKVKVEENTVKELMEESDLFAKEMDMYNSVLPEFVNILNEGGISKKISCRSILNNTSPTYIVMENLKSLGFNLADPVAGLNLDECKITLDKMALLHAASMKFYDGENLKTLKDFYKQPMIRDTKLSRKIFSENVKTKTAKIKELLTSRPGYEKALIYIENMGSFDSIMDRMCSPFQCIPGNIFNAQLHGDCWTSNYMYKYENNGQLIDAVLLDFQFSNYASVANDFMHIFFSSANDFVREKHFSTLVEHYYSCLTKTLKSVSYERRIPSLNEFWNELKAKVDLAILVTIMLLPNTKVDFSANRDADRRDNFTIIDVMKKSDDTLDSAVYKKSLFLSMDIFINEGFI